MILIGDVTEQPVDSRTESALSGVKQTCSLSHSERASHAAGMWFYQKIQQSAANAEPGSPFSPTASNKEQLESA